MSTRLVAAVAAGIAALGLSGRALAEQPWRWSNVPRVVAVGDVHGAYSELTRLLEAAGIVDDSLRWSGGDSTLVSLGDLIDRGPASRKVLDLFMRLQTEAAAQGGAVHVVLGNHEVMNLVGDLRYVSKAQYAEFADDEPQSLRDAAFRRFLARQDASATEARAREGFDERYPPGYFARRLAFLPSGRYGQWLLSLPAVIVVNDTAFVHGGLSEAFASTAGGALNERISEDLSRYLSLRAELANAGVLPETEMQRDIPLAGDARRRLRDGSDPALAEPLEEFLRLADAPELGAAGPLWYRGAIYCKPILARPELEDALAGFDAARIVVGHTPAKDGRVRSLYDGRLVMLDTGMLTQYFHGHPAALILENGRLSVRYLDRPDPVAPEPGRSAPYGLDEQRTLEALAAGDATLAAARPESVTRATIEYAGERLDAMFYPETRRGTAERELAAYRLDALLDFDLVPPSVQREIDGIEGTLQLRYADQLSEAERIERRLPSGEWCPMAPQLQLMYTFDVLTENSGRTRDSLQYHEQVSDLVLTDNGEAFGTDRGLPRIAEGALTLSPTVVRALASLTEARLAEALGRTLDRRQIAALLARRDELIGRFGPSAEGSKP